MSTEQRPLRLAAAALLLAQAIVVAVLVGRGPAMVLPVAMSSGSHTIILTGVDVGVAVIVPLVLGAMSLLIGARRGERTRLIDHGLRWVEVSLSSSITVFLIAQLNGIRELGALVAIYALTSAAVLFAALQERQTDTHRMLPAIFGAMVGIVPWGLIAWYEIAPTLAFSPLAGGGGPALWVRVLTLTMLALFLAAGVAFWRASVGRGSGLGRPGGTAPDRTHRDSARRGRALGDGLAGSGGDRARARARRELTTTPEPPRKGGTAGMDESTRSRHNLSNAQGGLVSQ